MTEIYPLDIEVSPAVKKYLEYHFAKRNFKLSQKDVFGSYLIGLIKRTPVGMKLVRIDKERELKLTVQRSSRHFKQMRSFHLPKNENKNFEQFVKKIMMLELNVKASFMLQSDEGNINDAIKSFRKKYSLTEEDLTFEAMKKQFYRTRKELNKLDNNELKNLEYFCPFLDQLIEHSLSKL